MELPPGFWRAESNEPVQMCLCACGEQMPVGDEWCNLCDGDKMIAWRQRDESDDSNFDEDDPIPLSICDDGRPRLF